MTGMVADKTVLDGVIVDKDELRVKYIKDNDEDLKKKFPN